MRDLDRDALLALTREPCAKQSCAKEPDWHVCDCEPCRARAEWGRRVFEKFNVAAMPREVWVVESAWQTARFDPPKWKVYMPFHTEQIAREAAARNRGTEEPRAWRVVRYVPAEDAEESR
jgi:hypothetical protein